jgi:hypothetical protein
VFGEGGRTVGRWIWCSGILSAIAIALFGVVVCGVVSKLPSSLLLPLAIASIASSAVAAAVGLVVCVILDLRGRSWAALAVVALAGLAGLPAFAMFVHLLLPND